uniref:Uncharacterized protein n=1 Tax=Meloidogyne enterolobii TaxID=390850 RepID=A0A6V7VYK1_MELEN|nr:unnamed protein product [Meloidogyne enterolobii]
MEYILWNRKEFDIIYNCTGINVDDIPIEKRRYPIAAIICILLGFIYYPIYFPCLYSFWKNRNKNPCYKLLIYLSILDIGILWLPTFSAGIFSLNGVVYCTSPISTYIVGCACLFLWAAECCADMILGINRCLEMAFPNISNILFHNNRVYIWIIFCNLYGLYWLLFIHPYIFNGLTFEYLFDPLIGYKDFRMELFKEDLREFTIHNTILAVGSPIIYSIFSLCVFFKARELIDNVSKEEKMVFIQVFIISMFNTSAAFAYAYNMNHPDHGIFPLMVAHFAWIQIHGFPPVIYLTLNKTVRTDTKILFGKFFSLFKANQNKVSSMLGYT